MGEFPRALISLQIRLCVANRQTDGWTNGSTNKLSDQQLQLNEPSHRDRRTDGTTERHVPENDVWYITSQMTLSKIGNRHFFLSTFFPLTASTYICQSVFLDSCRTLCLGVVVFLYVCLSNTNSYTFSLSL